MTGCTEQQISCWALHVPLVIKVQAFQSAAESVQDVDSISKFFIFTDGHCNALQGGAQATPLAAMTSALQLASLAREAGTMSEGILRSLDAVVRCDAQAKPSTAPDVAIARQSAHSAFCMRSSGV